MNTVKFFYFLMSIICSVHDQEQFLNLVALICRGGCTNEGG
jgi:hypothetical protein